MKFLDSSKSHNFLGGLCGGLLVTLIVSALIWTFQYQTATAKVESGLAWRSEVEQRTIDVYKTAKDAVVFILTSQAVVDPFDLFVGVQPQQGSGSGIIVDNERGIIITNLHVIQDASRIEIVLADGKPYEALVLGFDREYDIAVLRLREPPAGLVSLQFGDSSKLAVGQLVLAIGNPFGLDRTLTTGVISSLERTVKSPFGHVMKEMIQTDAAINPGNSGGPLLDSEGRLIGVNTAILSQSGDSAGIGFAVPINRIRRILPELIATGRVLRPKMGWVLVDTTDGPMVLRLQADGPADQAGIQPVDRFVGGVFYYGYRRDFERGDLVYKINSERVYSRDQVEELIAKSTPDKGVSVTLRRGGVRGPERTVRVKPVLQ